MLFFTKEFVPSITLLATTEHVKCAAQVTILSPCIAEWSWVKVYRLVWIPAVTTHRIHHSRVEMVTVTFLEVNCTKCIVFSRPLVWGSLPSARHVNHVWRYIDRHSNKLLQHEMGTLASKINKDKALKIMLFPLSFVEPCQTWLNIAYMSAWYIAIHGQMLPDYSQNINLVAAARSRGSGGYWKHRRGHGGHTRRLATYNNN